MYTWNSRKDSKQHIVGPDGRALCKVENGGARLDVVEDKKNPYRKVCGTCLKKSKPKKKKKPHQAKKNGAKKYRDKFYRSMAWKKVRYKALKMNDGRCECCGLSKHEGAVLNVDHIKPRSKRPDLELKISNLQVLCASCNMGKNHEDETDWREPSLAKLMGEKM
jgi:5-methylcytosine-specific restriction endonuclease McrA